MRQYNCRTNDDVFQNHQSPFSLAVILIAAWLALWLDSPTQAADESLQPPKTVSVSQTYNHGPFEYRIQSATEKAGYTLLRLSYPSPVVTSLPQNNTIPAEYYLPTGIRPGEPKRPAVICMHILDGNFELVRMTCSMLATRGIPAIMFKLPYYGERGLPEGPETMAANPTLFVGALSQAMQDVRRTVDLLASRPEVDRERIGITGISLGGIVAATAAAVEPRLARALLILAGGDLNTIIHHARETESLSQTIDRLSPQQRTQIEQAIRAVDPLEHAEKLRDRAGRGKVLMINAAEDRVVPPACTEKLARALGIADRVIWLDGLGHYTAMAALPQVLETTVDFFSEDLPPGIETGRAVASGRTPLEVVTSFLRQLAALITTEPKPGRCHFVDLHLAATPKDEDTIQAQLRFIRGPSRKFKLECRLPFIGHAALGQNNCPWMASEEKILIKGTGNPAAEPGNPLAFAEPTYLVKLQVAAGAAAGISLAPGVLEQVITVTEDETSSDGPRAIRITLKEKSQGSLRLILRNDGKTPHKITFDVADVRGTLTVRALQTNTVAHAALFDPPAGLPTREVDQVDLYRIFSAMFNFAMESTE